MTHPSNRPGVRAECEAIYNIVHAKLEAALCPPATSSWTKGEVAALASNIATTIALTAPEKPRGEPEWQPIETAPRDGTKILLGWFEPMQGEDMQFAYWSDWRNRWVGDYTVFTNHVAYRPTHWMPRPAALLASGSREDETTTAAAPTLTTGDQPFPMTKGD